MRKGTKLLSALLALVMALGLLPMTALAAEDANITWLPHGMVVTGYIPKTQRVIATQNGHVVLLDKTGQVVETLNNFSYLSDFRELTSGLTTAVGTDGMMYIVNDDLKVLGAINGDKYDRYSPSPDGLCAVREKDTELWGYVDFSGQEVIPFTYTGAGAFHEGLACVSIGEDWSARKTGFIDKTGKVVIPFDYKNAEGFSDGLACVYNDGKYGCIDTTGKVVIPLQYKSQIRFYEGLAYIDETGEYIDRSGKTVLQGTKGLGIIFGNFFDGLAPVRLKNGDYGFMDKTGQVATPVTIKKYYSSEHFDSGLICYADRDRHPDSNIYDCVDKNGNYVLSEGYDGAWIYGACGIVSTYGKTEDDPGTYGIFVNPCFVDPNQPVAAAPTNDSLKVNGVLQNATVYKINDSNYFKIRDLGAMLNGTSKQFSVGYDAGANAVTAASGQAYTPAGGELAGAATGGNKAAQVSNDAIYINGQKASVEVYKIDGSNYFKLRDLGSALGFDVGWTAEEGMFINTEG